MARQRRDPEREAFWRGALKRFDGSGLSVRAFCQRERLTESAFYAWRRTIAQRDGDRRQRGTPGRPSFLPLRVTHHAAPDSSISIELAGGRVLRLPDSTSPERLAALIHALEARARG
jgi:transposase-like protein